MLSARLYQLPSHLYAEESAAITAAPRQCYKGYPDRKTEAEFALFSFICRKEKTDAPCPLWGTGSRQGEASCKFMGHLLVTLTNRSQDNTSFVIHQKSASHFQQKLTSFHPPSISMLKSTKSPEQS